MPSFLRASDAIRLVFYPHAAKTVEPKCIRKRVVARERRRTKTDTRNFSHGLIKLSNDFGSCYEVKTKS
jgi:hypothetical protein